MTGRGIDQILPHPSEPALYEPYMTSAAEYVTLAEQVTGPIARPVDFAYIWGEALEALEERRPDFRIVNLETSVTTSAKAEPKGINYRMNPANVLCLLAAGIDCCILANNHVLDWGVPGLLETLDILAQAGIMVAGAGRTEAKAAWPAVMKREGQPRLLVFAFGETSSGVPPGWRATSRRPGVAFLGELSNEAAQRVVAGIRQRKRERDLVVVSIHWGGNWGYTIPETHRAFAHRLVDSGCVDVVYGHSSHHVKGIEVYNGRLILYGCGDFITDYEGITGHEEFRPELVAAYFVRLDPGSGRLVGLEVVPFRSRRFRLERCSREDAGWLAGMLTRQGRKLGTQVALRADGTLSLGW